MAVSMPDVDRLFTDRTVVEVAGFCSETQREIHATQEQLRQLIGAKYRDLLECCDLVVGMEDVCTQIEQRWAGLRRGMNGHRLTNGTDGTADRRDQPSLSLAGVRQPTSHFVSDDGRIELSVMEDLTRAAFAALVLLEQCCFSDAVIEYRRTESALEKIQAIVLGGANHVLPTSDPAAAQVDVVKRALSLFPGAFRSYVLQALATHMAQGPMSSLAAFYDDVQQAQEQWLCCGRNRAVDEVLALHTAVLTGDVPSPKRGTRPAATNVRAVFIVTTVYRGLAYIAQMSDRNTPSQPPSTIRRGMGLAELVQLDPADPAFEQTLLAEVCGRGVLNPLGGGSTEGFDGAEVPPPSALDGWVSPMPPASRPLPAELGSVLCSDGLAALRCVLMSSTGSLLDVSSIVDAEEAVERALGGLQQLVADAPQQKELAENFTAKLRDLWSTAVTEAASGHVEAAAKRVEGSIKALVEEEETQEKGTSIISAPKGKATSGGRAAATLASLSATCNRRLQKMLLRSSAAGETPPGNTEHGFSAPGSGSPVEVQLKAAVRRHTSRGAKSVVVVLGHRVRAALADLLSASRRAAALLRGTLSDPRSRAGRCLAIAQAIATFGDMVERGLAVQGDAYNTPTTSASSSTSANDLTTTLRQCHALQVELHEPWAVASTEPLQTSIRDPLRTLLERASVPAAELEVRWASTSTTSEPAGPRYPVRPSSWLHVALMTVVGGAQDAYPANARLEGNAQSVLRQAAVAALANTVQSALDDVLGVSSTSQGPSEEALLQLLFDVLYVAMALGSDPTGDQAGPQHGLPKEATVVVDRLKQQLDSATLAAVERVLLDGVVAAASATRLLFAGPLAQSKRTSATPTAAKRLLLAREAPRISNVPLPTLPRPVARQGSDVAALDGVRTAAAAALEAASTRGGAASTSGDFAGQPQGGALRSLRNIMGSWG